MEDRSDNLLVKQAIRGDGDSFTELCRRYYGPLVAIGHAILGDRHLAEDAAQEAFAKAAVDICLHKAKAGSLPAALPAGLPKDPFSGRDFQYERTAGGFTLRCQGKDLDKDIFQEFQFVVK